MATGEFAVVVEAEGVGVLAGEVGEFGGAGGGRVGAEEVGHKGGDFVAGDDDIVDGQAGEATDQIGEGWGDGDDGAGSADEEGDFLDEGAVGEGFGADGVDGDVGGFLAEGDGEGGEVIDVDGLEAVEAVAEDAEEGEFAEDPGDVVDEDVMVAEEDGGAEDGVGEVSGFEGGLEVGLAAEVLEGGVFGGVGDADVDDAADACGLGGVEEGEGVLDGGGVGEGFVVEADPVGVVEGVDILEGLGEGGGVVEREGADVELGGEGVIGLRGVGESSDGVAGGEKTGGDTLAGVAEGAGDGMDGGHGRLLVGDDTRWWTAGNGLAAGER